MREIKFRGRVKNTNKPQWVYGIVIPPQYSSWDDWTLFDGERRWIVDPETVGQYTGYKDVDGKEIYEGDILANFEPPVGRRIIRFGEYGTVSEKEKFHYGFYVEFLRKREQDIFRKDFIFWINHFGNWKCCVIGNIHDNPELVKGEKNE